MIRKIVSIDEKKCNGCGLCVNACHEGAIELVDGVAKLISDEYCDGLGDCLPACPTGAIEIIERESGEYNEELVMKKMAKNFVCPGTAAKMINRKKEEKSKCEEKKEYKREVNSELSQWPVQLRLINPNAGYLENANLLFAADCTAYAYGDFHKDFIKNHITIIACPKLDDNEYNVEKITEILKNNNINSITIARMEVPCCNGMTMAVKKAMMNSGNLVPFKEVIIGTDGQIINN